MRTFLFIIATALSLSFLPAWADDMSTMHHNGGMTTTSNATASTAADYHSQGVIKRWDGQRVAIAHHAIPALNWPPMTMTFAVPQGLAGKTPAAGTTVDFSFRQDDQGYSLTAIHPMQP